MVRYVVAEQLIGKDVITNDGFYLGKFIDADFNEVTGKLVSLLVDPNMDSSFVQRLDMKEGKLRLPYEAVIAVNDFIVLDKKQILGKLN